MKIEVVIGEKNIPTEPSDGAAKFIFATEQYSYGAEC